MVKVEGNKKRKRMKIGGIYKFGWNRGVCYMYHWLRENRRPCL